MFTMSFDQRSLSEIAQLAGFQAFLTEEMAGAMAEAGTLLQEAAVANTWEVFENPNGDLAGTIEAVLDSPFEVQIGSDSPYARRREEGFMGMTDSLGRGPFDDPAKPYMQPALDDNQQAVLLLIDRAVEAAFERIGATF